MYYLFYSSVEVDVLFTTLYWVPGVEGYIMYVL